MSISVTDYSRPGVLDLAAAAADEGRIDTVWVPDHLIQAAPGSDPESEMFEAVAVLGYLAGRTTRVRLGALVFAATYRPAAILIKSVATVDALSGGRAWLGVGAGYLEEEAERFGVPLPPVPERFDVLESTLGMARKMWDGPVLVGGTGEKRTLRLVAQYADACNLFDIPDGGKTVRHKLDVLARHCEDVGRPFEAIEKTLSTRLGPDETPQGFVERVVALGVDHAIVLTTGPWTAPELERVAAVAAAA
ncbi:MAG TPA: LLM class flavin-dependent oxidoreductase [Solirubrobacter sp.]|nr:LLM class flavin-dependent oxidoreductase [Solirubrobacter sp.]